MNRYDLWRFFGYLPEPPEVSYTLGPDKALSLQQARSDSLTSLISTAFRFSRLDDLNDMLETGVWEESGDGLLCRGRLRFYRAVIENPESPDIGLLEESSVDFRRASDNLSSPYEALAGLARIHALIDGRKAAEKILRRLERLGGRGSAAAAIGVCLFLAGLSGSNSTDTRRFLRRAVRQSRRAGTGTEILLIRLHIKDRLEAGGETVTGWRTLARRGSLEARIHLIESEIRSSVPSFNNERRETLLADIEEYKRNRPTDPRAFIAEGNLLLPIDPETARMAWRAALVLDDRYAEAWKRLGDLYRDEWDRWADEYRSTWLEAAGDAYIKAVTLNPLNPSYRMALGIVERESGRPAMAIGTFLGGLALTTDDNAIRRWLALSWTDLGYSRELSPSARSAAAGRARTEWTGLLSRGVRHPYDLMGLLRSIAVEIAEEAEKAAELKEQIGPLSNELVRTYPAEESVDFIGLAEDFARAGISETATLFLDKAAESDPALPELHAVRAVLLESTDPAESIRMYLSAVSTIKGRRGEKILWLIAAADLAFSTGRQDYSRSIIRNGLRDFPGSRALVRKLSEMLEADGLNREAVNLYLNALHNSPEDPDLLEDAVWFTRSIGEPQAAEKIIRDAIEVSPRESRLWNQLGVHFMEIGWNEESDRPDSDSLAVAINAYRRAVELEPENPVMIGNLGDALRQAEKFTEAEELLIKAVEGGIDVVEDAFAVNSLARLEDERSYSTSGGESSADDWQSSGNHYRQAADSARGNSDFQRDFAWWLYRERRLEEAIVYYKRGAAVDPSDDSLPYGESVCWLELGNEEAALDSLERALMVKPGNLSMLADKADLLGFLGQNSESERIYHDLLSSGRSETWILERYAEFLEQQAIGLEMPYVPPTITLEGPGNFDVRSLLPAEFHQSADHPGRRAVKIWEESFKAEPDNLKFRSKYGMASAKIGEFERAISLLASPVNSTAEEWNGDALYCLGRLEIMEAVNNANQNMWTHSKNHLSAAIELSPLNPFYQSGLGYWYFLKGEWQMALEAFRQASDRLPGEAVFAANTGISACAAGNFDEGTAYLRRALSLRDTEADWQNTLGLCLLASGQPEYALDAFRSACLIDPGNGMYPANLVMAHQSLYAPEGPIQ